MNSKLLVKAAAAALIFIANGASASEPSFQAPSTDRAAETLPLLTQAARALTVSANRNAGGEHVANLWLYPTDGNDTVFAQYELVSDKDASILGSRLELLKLKGPRIVERHELIRTRTPVVTAGKSNGRASDASASNKNLRIVAATTEEK